MRNLLRLLREARSEIIGGLLVAAVTTVIGALYTRFGIGAIVVGIVSGLWLGCAYLAFKRTTSRRKRRKETWEYLRWRPWALAGLIIIPLLTAGRVGYHLYQQTRPPTKVIILVADFVGPEPEKYAVTASILEQLQTALRSEARVQVQALGKPITVQQGSDIAKETGREHKAAIVIWGWYAATKEAATISAHYEILEKPECIPRIELKPEIMAIAHLESFELQTRLSQQMSYLTAFTVGMMHYAEENYREAEQSFSIALAQTDEFIRVLDQSIVYLYRGKTFASRGNYQQAIADYTRAIEVNPALSEAYHSLALVYSEQSQYEKGITEYTKAIELSPQCAACPYNNRGLAYAHQGDYDKAIADFTTAIQQDPQLFCAYLNRGNAYVELDDCDKAISDYTKAIELDSQSACAYANRGNAYQCKGEYGKAIADHTKAIQLDPEWAGSYQGRGVSHVERGKYSFAIVDLTKAIKLDPESPACVYEYRGIAYAELHDYDRAIDDLTKAIELDPQSAPGYTNRGITYLELGNYETAIADLTRTMELDPECPACVYRNRGWAYYNQGEYAEAIADYSKAIELEPQSYCYYLDRGEAYDPVFAQKTQGSIL